MIFKGFQFGMLLQLAIGPVFFFIFQAAAQNGFWAAETGVLGVFLIDALFIFLAVIGVASIIEKKNIKLYLKLTGALVLCLFGASTVLNVFNIHFMPALNLQGISDSGVIFVRALVLTASSPITILFWAGVFSVKISESGMQRSRAFLFALGALLSTLFFLSCTAILGSLASNAIPLLAVQIINIAVGCCLIFFGIRMLLKKV